MLMTLLISENFYLFGICLEIWKLKKSRLKFVQYREAGVIKRYQIWHGFP